MSWVILGSGCSGVCGQLVVWLELKALMVSLRQLRSHWEEQGDWATRLTIQQAPWACLCSAEFQEQQGVSLNSQALFNSLLASCLLPSHWTKQVRCPSRVSRGGHLQRAWMQGAGSSLGPLLQSIHHDELFNKRSWGN